MRRPTPTVRIQQVMPTTPNRSLASLLEENERFSEKEPFLRLRSRLGAWKRLTADKSLLRAIARGVEFRLRGTPRPYVPRKRVDGLVDKLQNELDLMSTKGVIRALTPKEEKATKAWIAVFGVPKAGSEKKIRVITDLRPVNERIATPLFKMDTWLTLCVLLEDPRASWGVTVDLQDFYHHLALSPAAGRWARFRDPKGQPMQAVGLPFGLSASPYWCHRLTRPLIAELRSRGILLHWYVDDILLLAPSPSEATSCLIALLTLLNATGFKVNSKKCRTEPSQQVQYLGHRLDLERGVVEPVLDKVKSDAMRTRKYLRQTTTSPKELASYAGRLEDARKSNAALFGINCTLMKDAARCALFHGWTRRHPLSDKLRYVLGLCRAAMAEPVPLPLWRGSGRPKLDLHTDASTESWGAVLSLNGQQLRMVSGQFPPAMVQLHITAKETMAPALAIQQVFPLLEGHRLCIHSDATAACRAWRKGSRLERLTALVRPTIVRLAQAGIPLRVEFTRGVDNVADVPSRLPSEKRAIIMGACNALAITPSLVKRFPCVFGPALLWLQLSWRRIHQALNQLADEPGARVLLLLPDWPSASWWPLVLKMSAARWPVPSPLLPQHARRWSCTVHLLSTSHASTTPV